MTSSKLIHVLFVISVVACVGERYKRSRLRDIISHRQNLNNYENEEINRFLQQLPPEQREAGAAEIYRLLRQQNRYAYQQPGLLGPLGNLYSKVVDYPRQRIRDFILRLLNNRNNDPGLNPGYLINVNDGTGNNAAGIEIPGFNNADHNSNHNNEREENQHNMNNVAHYTDENFPVIFLNDDEIRRK